MSPHALRQRMKHGNVYPPERAQVALDRFFTEANLTALRELRLRLVARRVEGQLEDTIAGQRLPLVTDRVLVLVDGTPGVAARGPARRELAGALHAGARRRRRRHAGGRSSGPSTAAATSRRRSTTPSTWAPKWCGSRPPTWPTGSRTWPGRIAATHIVIPHQRDSGVARIRRRAARRPAARAAARRRAPPRRGRRQAGRVAVTSRAPAVSSANAAVRPRDWTS